MNLILKKINIIINLLKIINYLYMNNLNKNILTNLIDN